MRGMNDEIEQENPVLSVRFDDDVGDDGDDDNIRGSINKLGHLFF